MMKRPSKEERQQWKAEADKRHAQAKVRQAKELEKAKQRNIDRAGGKKNADAAAAGAAAAAAGAAVVINATFS